ncbi:hypothetical protein PoB_007070000 [Plakobranchus ocellatus]|uniref:Uncharacterized protein n=1 Tax=Plakobranchus ocellatus TaxID=259542 RepID=A0AAV4DJN8_9GAST|nr:hypothetical protein PoB_007070000 [Plakobranchus ocellatus]
MTFNLLSQLTDRSTIKKDEDEGSPVDDVGVETDDESDVDFDVEEGEVDGLRLDSSDDDESEWYCTCSCPVSIRSQAGILTGSELAQGVLSPTCRQTFLPLKKKVALDFLKINFVFIYLMSF